MPSNLVYLGLHFTIGKCEFRRSSRWKCLSQALLGYANSLLATCVFTGSSLSGTPDECLGDSLNMRDYVKRTAGAALEIINIRRPSSDSSVSSPFPMINRPRAWCELDDEMQTRTGSTGVSPM